MAESLRSASELRRIPLDLIDAHPANVRESLGDEDLLELAESIRTVGLLQPIVVAPKPGGRFEILAGHRRHAAVMLTTEQSVMCVVRTRRPERAEALELMLVENLHRRALNPIEEAEAYQALVNMGQTQTAIGHAVGKSITHVSQRLSLLLLPADQQRALVRREMTVMDAYEMAREIREKTTGRKHGLTGRTRDRWGKRWHENTVPHFNPRHSLAPTAKQRCEGAGHQDFARIGGACGPCWEAVIRDDALAQAEQVAS